MKRKKTFCIMIISLLLLLAGCGNHIPEMTKEQSAQISEYAAGLLLKYDEGNVNRLTDVPSDNSIENAKSETE